MAFWATLAANVGSRLLGAGGQASQNRAQMASNSAQMKSLRESLDSLDELTSASKEGAQIEQQESFENIGKKANMALKEIQGKAKIRKAKETSILSKVLSKFNLQKNVNRYTKNLNSKRGKQDIYTSTEKEIIGNILNDIKYEDSLAGYGVILDKIDNNLISWNKIEDITIRTKKGQKLLKNIASMLRKKIKEVSEVDEIRSLNKEVAELTEV